MSADEIMKRMRIKYMLVGQTPVPTEDLLEWARWFETCDRVVKQTWLKDLLVSTIFLGLDHNLLGAFTGTDEKHLFETMIFRYRGKSRTALKYQTRCGTWLEAEAMHEQAIEWAVRKRLVRT